MKKTKVTYSDFINAIDDKVGRGIIETRWDCVCWCVGYYGAVDETIWEHIRRAYGDNFFKA